MSQRLSGSVPGRPVLVLSKTTAGESSPGHANKNRKSRTHTLPLIIQIMGLDLFTMFIVLVISEAVMIK